MHLNCFSEIKQRYAGKPRIIFLEADLLLSHRPSRSTKRLSRDAMTLASYFTTMWSVIYFTARGIYRHFVSQVMLQKTTNKYITDIRLSKASTPQIVLFGSMYSRNSICRRCSRSSWSVAVSRSLRTGSSLDEFWAPLVVMAKTLLRHSATSLDGRWERCFFCPLVRSLYSPVRHADVDLGSTI